MGYPTQDPNGNYATLPISPALASHAAFAPRSGILPMQFASLGGPSFNDAEQQGVDPQYQRYSIDPRRS